jgi:transposase InsO family protein
MRRLDELHLKYSFYGNRKLAFELKRQGLDANRKRIQRLMRVMGLESLAPTPNTSAPAPEHAKYPYLRGLAITRPNQVWASNITYIPMRTGFIYLVAVIDWHTRRVLSWRLSNTMDSGFCVEALLEALDRHGAPGTFNTDQGSPFTAAAPIVGKIMIGTTGVTIAPTTASLQIAGPFIASSTPNAVCAAPQNRRCSCTYPSSRGKSTRRWARDMARKCRRAVDIPL